jgi:hypothetical protein
VNNPSTVEVWPPTEAVTDTVPVPAGVVAVQLVADEQATALAALGPKWKTVAPAAVEKPVPVMVTGVAPDWGPKAGATPVTVGGGGRPT